MKDPGDKFQNSEIRLFSWIEILSMNPHFILNQFNFNIRGTNAELQCRERTAE